MLNKALPTTEELLAGRGFLKDPVYHDYHEKIEKIESHQRPSYFKNSRIGYEGSVHFGLGRTINPHKIKI
jgi:hypothetical protein